MLDQLQDGFGKIVKSLRGEGKITESNIRESMRNIRRVLLEADVNYKIVREFTDRVQEKALGADVAKNLKPGQVIVKIISDELKTLLGRNPYRMKTANTPPTVIMLVGLQGCGKTTLSGKLAKKLKSEGQRPLLVPVDVYRPAAIEQLAVLGKQIDVPVFTEKGNVKGRVKAAISHARKNNHDTIIIDTAGRLHIDKNMMSELQMIKKVVSPNNIIFVADGLTGQDAVNTGQEFQAQIGFDAIVLTKMDSDTKGGAALSIVESTGKPIYFLSTGEKLEDLEVFHPERMAERILGMGDIISLVEKVQSTVDEEAAAKLEKRIMQQQFDLEDYLSQIKQMKKMGPLENILEMLPGAFRNAAKNPQIDPREIDRMEAIILSMTRHERRKPDILNGSRRKRIAAGSGTQVSDVNRLIKQYNQVKKLTKQIGKMRLPKNLASVFKMG
ncbi:MAG: signal recognition particle protein [Candidatus Marinimicrobia bacterium]|nr:signal recognition particle protein [Candidatus Neomarinimicrobiota bacterium]